MIFKFRSSRLGTLIAVISIAAGGVSTAGADTVMTVKDVDVDSAVFDAYLESRFQKPPHRLRRKTAPRSRRS